MAEMQTSGRGGERPRRDIAKTITAAIQEMLKHPNCGEGRQVDEAVLEGVFVDHIDDALRKADGRQALTDRTPLPTPCPAAVQDGLMQTPSHDLLGPRTSRKRSAEEPVSPTSAGPTYINVTLGDKASAVLTIAPPQWAKHPRSTEQADEEEEHNAPRGASGGSDSNA